VRGAAQLPSATIATRGIIIAIVRALMRSAPSGDKRQASSMLTTGVLASLVLFAPFGLQRSARDPGCADWRACREQALAAADRGDYERFHDLAWRAVQLGPSKDPALMSLLARAQALSGRPHDALVMIDRLAEMGVAVDADTNDDFTRTRELPGWPEVAAHIDRVRHAAAPGAVAAGTTRPAAVAPAAPAAPAAAAAPAPAAEASAPAPLEALKFSTAPFTPGGLAYDAVSGRFLFADRDARKLFIVSERSNRATDYVRADSAGFQEIAAIEIDEKRGDLWVASTASAEGRGTLHKLQLVSGRPLRSFRIPADFEPVSLVDLAVTGSGAVLLLDSVGRQILMLRPGASTVERVMRLDVAEPASLAADGDEGIAYVAHHDGVARIDLRARSASPLSAPSAVPLDRLERIRWRGHALIAVHVDQDGSRRIVRLDLNPSGRAVAQAATLERAAPIAQPTFLTFLGDDLVYLADGVGRADGNSSGDASRPTDFVAYRLRLR
jgi:hypothetical protein